MKTDDISKRTETQLGLVLKPAVSTSPTAYAENIWDIVLENTNLSELFKYYQSKTKGQAAQSEINELIVKAIIENEEVTASTLNDLNTRLSNLLPALSGNNGKLLAINNEGALVWIAKPKIGDVTLSDSTTLADIGAASTTDLAGKANASHTHSAGEVNYDSSVTYLDGTVGDKLTDLALKVGEKSEESSIESTTLWDAVEEVAQGGGGSGSGEVTVAQVNKIIDKVNDILRAGSWDTMNGIPLLSRIRPVTNVSVPTMTLEIGSSNSVTMTADEGATIYYSKNGGTYITYSSAVTISGDTTIKSKAVKDNKESEDPSGLLEVTFYENESSIKVADATSYKYGLNDEVSYDGSVIEVSVGDVYEFFSADSSCKVEITE